MNKIKGIAATLGITLSAVGGNYMFIGGKSDEALGVVGQYKMGEARVQTLTYPGPNFFEKSVKITKQHDPDLRRLSFKCEDQSKSFTIYFLGEQVVGVPDTDIQCKDGSYLIKYDPTKSFVIEQ